MKIVLMSLLAFGVSWLATAAGASCNKCCHSVDWTRTRSPDDNNIYCLRNDVFGVGAKAWYFRHNINNNKVDSDEPREVTILRFAGDNCTAPCDWDWAPEAVVAADDVNGVHIGSFLANLHTNCLDP